MYLMDLERTVKRLALQFYPRAHGLFSVAIDDVETDFVRVGVARRRHIERLEWAEPSDVRIHAGEVQDWRVGMHIQRHCEAVLRIQAQRVVHRLEKQAVWPGENGRDHIRSEERRVGKE